MINTVLTVDDTGMTYQAKADTSINDREGSVKNEDAYLFDDSGCKQGECEERTIAEEVHTSEHNYQNTAPQTSPCIYPLYPFQ